MHFDSTFARHALRWLWLAVLSMPHSTKAERVLLFRPDDGRSQQSIDNRILTHADLWKYDRIISARYDRGPVRGSTSNSQANKNNSLSKQAIPSSPLPSGFREVFKKSWFVRERSVDYFKQQFHHTLQCYGLVIQPDEVFKCERAQVRRCEARRSDCVKSQTNQIIF